MPLKQTQPRPGHLSSRSKNPVDRKGGRSDGTGGGQKRLGHTSDRIKGGGSNKGGRREVPAYAPGDNFNTGRVDKRRASQSVTDVSANKVKKIGG